MRRLQEPDMIRVRCPREYDGIGQALRSAFHDARETEGQLNDLLRKLDGID